MTVLPLVFDLIDDPCEEWDLMDKRLDCGWVLRPVAERLGALAQSATRYPHIKPGEEFTGYSWIQEGLMAAASTKPESLAVKDVGSVPMRHRRRH